MPAGLVAIATLGGKITGNKVHTYVDRATNTHSAPEFCYSSRQKFSANSKLLAFMFDAAWCPPGKHSLFELY